ncbi:MAG: methyltransferase domain-containing protein, partial [Deltaproteobacteria bacterium]|nr:methyltransferase domain-containing protein [Deltaproteobacteria bacterium]
MSKRTNLLCFFYASFSMMYYLLFTRALAEMTGDITVWSAVSSATYLCFLGIGIALSHKTSLAQSRAAVGTIEAVNAGWGGLAMLALYLWHMIYRIYMYTFGYDLAPMGIDTKIVFATLSQLLLGGTGLISGVAFGLVSQLALGERLARLQRTLAIYQVGGLMGSLVLLLVLLPKYEPIYICLATSMGNFAAALLWPKGRDADDADDSTSSIPRRYTAAAAVVIVAVAVFTWSSDLVQVQIKNFYYNSYKLQMAEDGSLTYEYPLPLTAWFRRAATYPAIERHRGLYQTVDIVRNEPPRIPLADRPAGWTLFLDGHFQASSAYEADYHQALAHLPATVAGAPGTNVLIIGGGDGLLARELLRYQNPNLKITLVDIDPLILQLAAEHEDLRRLNHSSLDHPQVEVMSADAFQMLRRAQDRYDRIFVDVLFPYNFETSRLYSVEFFEALRRHLTPSGTVSILSPVEIGYEVAGDSDDEATLTLLRDTLQEAGFTDVYLYGEQRHSFFLAK